MSVPATTFLILLLVLQAGTNPPSAPQSHETKKPYLSSLTTEYENDCGSPLVESMVWASISGKVIEVVEGNAIIVLMANDERKHISLAGVRASRTKAAHALLTSLVLNREVTVLINPSNTSAKEVSGVVHAQTRDINRALIEAGASRYQKPGRYAMSDYTACVYRILEKQAREVRRGIWAKENGRDYPDFVAPDSKFFRDKLGEPAELYRHKSGVNVQVAYDNKGRACSIYITDSIRDRGVYRFKRLLAVADELMPESSRGTLRGKTSDIGNCISVEYRNYERVFLIMNRDACYDQGIRILFKRPSCPKPPQVPGLTSEAALVLRRGSELSI